MPDRKSLVSLLWLALLASVFVASIRTSGLVVVSSRPGCLRPNLTPPPDQSTTHLSAAVPVDASSVVNALTSENEEQNSTDDWDEPRPPFLIPGSFREISDYQRIAPRSIPSLYPLRC